jgi:hypothetical protein
VEQARTKWDWPVRNPEVKVSESGEFIGEGPTETDDMSRREIFEAMLYLDDFLHFSLHTLYDRSIDDCEKARMSDFARRMFRMIEKRTIRDLIVRALPNLSPERRRSAYQDILRMDQGREEHFGDVTAGAEHHPSLTKFLTKITFENGHDTMKRLSVTNRIRLMELLSRFFESTEGGFNRVRYTVDSLEAGAALDRSLAAGSDCLAEFKLDSGREGVLLIKLRSMDTYESPSIRHFSV